MGICMAGCDGRDRHPCCVAVGIHEKLVSWQFTAIQYELEGVVRVRGGESGSWVWEDIIMSQRQQLLRQLTMAADRPGHYTLIHAQAFMPAMCRLEAIQHFRAERFRSHCPWAKDYGIINAGRHRSSGRLCLCGGNPSRLSLGVMPAARVPKTRCGKSLVSINAGATDVSTVALRVFGSWDGWSSGCLDMATAALYSFPSTYFILKLYIRVLSLSRRSLGFGMSCRSLSPSSFTRGSWSTNCKCEVQVPEDEHTAFFQCIDNCQSLALDGV